MTQTTSKTWLVIATVLGVLDAGTSLADERPAVINVGCAGGGYGNPYTIGPIGTVHSKGLLEQEFKKDGISIHWQFFKGAGPAVNEAISNGSLDFAQIGDFPAIIGRASGLKTRYIVGSTRGDINILVPPDSTIRSVAELRGKRVGLFKGTNAQPVFLRVLEEHGLTEKDVTILNMQSTEVEMALATRDVDAAVGMLRARDVGIAKVLYSTNPGTKAIEAGRFPLRWKATGGMVVTEKFARAYPEITGRFVKVYLQAARWGSEERNRDALLRLWAKSGVPLVDLQEMYRAYDAKTVNGVLIDRSFIEHQKDVLSFAFAKRYVRRTFDVESWVDVSFQERAVSALGLEGFWPGVDARGNAVSAASR
jgi:sulfonate transport system substrate-binding protein